mgnify:CR=1 FL=1
MTIKRFFLFPAESVLLGEHTCDGRCGSGIAVRSAERTGYIYPPRRGCDSARCEGHGSGGSEKMFRNRGLVCIVSDSSYVKTLPAGCILEYNPAAGQKVKEGRTIYLTINTIEVPLHIVPDCGGQQFAAAGGSAYSGFGLQAGRDTVYSG